ncbi:ATP synthase subunit C lysine N-methyltransferase isoform X3 [Bufo bufo]|uniref:ATP synthase subunit C lysine N-methyltransferase isoform X3 n=1 Tax=Bufo bufo TaxID=8384 RepID=UPI001ABE8621|nr:ATP synthase subunit C lysine N-methyltransferase isoform X3 [Bufo bufo]
MPHFISSGSISEELSLNSNSENQKPKRWGLVATGFVGGTLLTLYAVATPFVLPALRKICLPYVPASETQVENVLKMLQFRSGTVVDIGSGDGRIVSFSQYTNIVIFGVPEMMPKLEEKLKMELSLTARVIACRFPFPRWIPDHISGQGIDTVWVYDMKKLNESSITGLLGEFKN